MTEIDLRTLDFEDEESSYNGQDFAERYPVLFNISRLFLYSLCDDFANGPIFINFNDFKEPKEGETVICDDLFIECPIVAIGLILRDSSVPVLNAMIEKYPDDIEVDEHPEILLFMERLKHLKGFFSNIRDVSFDCCYMKFPEMSLNEESSGIAFRRQGKNIVLVTLPLSELDRAKQLLVKAVLKKRVPEGPEDVMKLMKTVLGGGE